MKINIFETLTISDGYNSFRRDVNSLNSTAINSDIKRKHCCFECDKQFHSKGTLKKHSARKHSEVKQYLCNQCGKQFAFAIDFQKHTESVHQEMRYCSMCDKGFKQLANLVEHELLHYPYRQQYQCKHCRKPFVTKAKFKTHENKCNKKYKCDKCNIMLSSKDTHEKHMRTHSGPPSFVCDQCGLKYFTKDNLKAHQKNKHSKGTCHKTPRPEINDENWPPSTVVTVTATVTAAHINATNPVQTSLSRTFNILHVKNSTHVSNDTGFVTQSTCNEL